jgi:hypothetical protein
MQTLKTEYVYLDHIHNWNTNMPAVKSWITQQVGTKNWRVANAGKTGVWVEVKREEPKPSFPDLRERSEGLNLDRFYRCW